MHSALQALGVHAQHIDVMWRTMLWVCGFMYLLVIAFLLHAVWRRRSPDGTSREPSSRELTGTAPRAIISSYHSDGTS